ncbi:hypothetical protein JCM10213_005105 [Rhodosporidiobolus nylandii]
MLDRLPIELLDKVLELAAPPLTNTLDDYIERDRRTTLRACALICRRVSRVAQALLWKDLTLVELDDVAKVQRALENEDNRRRAMGTRTALAGGSANVKDLEALLPQLGGLAELRNHAWYSGVWLSVTTLASLSNLRILEIDDLTLKGDWASARFPSLVRLRLDGVYFVTDTQALPSVFCQDAFPALRALELSNLVVDDGENSARGFPTLPLPFLAQLDMLSLSAWDLDVLPPVFSSSTPVVLGVSSYHLATAQRADSVASVQPRHLALWPVRKGAEVPQSLSALAHLCSLPTHPSSLHLPHSLLALPSSASALQQLEQGCKQHGVELLWYDGGEDDLFFHFWRYAKKLKAAQQASGEV